MHMTRGRLFFLVTLIGLLFAPALLGAPAPAAAASCFDLLANGNMESTGGWQITGGPPLADYDTAQAVSPTHSMRLGIISGPNTFGFSGIQQQIIIPANATSATLSWSVWPFLASSGENDYQELILQDAGTSSTVVVLWRDQRNDRSWINLTRDVLAYKGQNLRLFANVRNDGVGSYAGMYLDNVSLMVCVADTPTPGPGGVVDGRVYLDANLNGLYDVGELGFASLPVSLAPGGSVLTDPSGVYTFGAQAAGNYTVSITPPPGYASTSPASVTITVNAGNQSVNFGLAPITPATSTPTPNVVTATPTWTPVVVTNTPTPTGPPTWTPTWTPIVVTNTPTPAPVIWTATPTWTPPGPPTFTPTATPIPPTGTFTPVPPTPTPPPTNTPLPAGCTNWLENSGFEDELQLGDPAWYYFHEALAPKRVTDPKHEGSWSVRLGTNETDAASFSSVRQDVTIPINAVSVELSWFYWARSDDPNDQGDYQEVLLMTPSDHPLRHQIIRELWARNRDVTDNWKERKADLKLSAGSHVVIYFNVYNNGNGKRRYMYLDDVKLNVCLPTPVPPTATPMPTDTPLVPPPPTATGTPTATSTPSAASSLLPEDLDQTRRDVTKPAVGLFGLVMSVAAKYLLLLLALLVIVAVLVFVASYLSDRARRRHPAP